MRYKKIPFSYDWDEIISQLEDEEMFDEVSEMLETDIVTLKDMDEIPWTELPDDTPMEKTGLYVRVEDDENYYSIVYDGEMIYEASGLDW